MTREEIINGLKFTVEMFLFDPSTGEKYTEPRNDMDKTTIDACRGAIKLLEQEPCEDAISRQAVLEAITANCIWENEYNLTSSRIKKSVESLPSVNPQPKTGHWIDIMVGDMPAQACDRCNTFYPLAYTGGGHKYCPNCGAKMESEDEWSDENE